MTRQDIITILNRYSGVYVIQVYTKEEYEKYKVGVTSTHLIHSIFALCVKKEWYPNADFGIVRFQIQATISLIPNKNT